MSWRKLAILTTLVALALVPFLTRGFSQNPTALANLAASLPPGTSAELTTNNIAPTLAFNGGASGMTFGFTENGAWHPVSRQFLSIGRDHSPTLPDTRPRFVSYP